MPQHECKGQQRNLLHVGAVMLAAVFVLALGAGVFLQSSREVLLSEPLTAVSQASAIIPANQLPLSSTTAPAIAAFRCRSGADCGAGNCNQVPVTLINLLSC